MLLQGYVYNVNLGDEPRSEPIRPSLVFFGRLLPGVRSVISLPAGTQRMILATFSLFTIAGSGIWNGLLVTLGALLGTQ